MRTDDKIECEGCGKRYYPAQGWAHKDCVVANRVDLVANKSPVVANKPDELVANRHGKYRDPEKRRGYMKAYMARKRAGLKGG